MVASFKRCKATSASSRAFSTTSVAAPSTTAAAASNTILETINPAITRSRDNPLISMKPRSRCFDPLGLAGLSHLLRLDLSLLAGTVDARYNLIPDEIT
ncbi:hypothetical protein BGX31_004224, partial [Mortierella sp. GBA43]